MRQACGWVQQSLIMISLVGHLQYQLAQLSHEPAAPICLDAYAHSAAPNTSHPHHKERQRHAFEIPCWKAFPLSIFFLFIWNRILDIFKVYEGREDSILKRHTHTTQVSPLINILLISFYPYLRFLLRSSKNESQLFYIYMNIYYI